MGDRSPDTLAAYVAAYLRAIGLACLHGDVLDDARSALLDHRGGSDDASPLTSSEQSVVDRALGAAVRREVSTHQEKVRATVRREAARLGRGQRYDDAEYHALGALYRAYERYDPTHQAGASLWTYAEVWVRRAARYALCRPRIDAPPDDAAGTSLQHPEILGLQTLLRSCLRDPRRAAKWTSLFLLRDYFLSPWEEIAQDLLDRTSPYGRPDDEQAPWTEAHREAHVTDVVFSPWAAVVGGFAAPDTGRSERPKPFDGDPEQWRKRLRRYFGRHLQAVRDCASRDGVGRPSTA